jgi:hypothetical protein
VREQAEDVLKTNETLLNEIGHLLSSGKYEDYKRVDEVRTFLQNQRSGLPQLTIIDSGNFEGKTAIYKVGDYFGYSRSDQEYRPVYFPCTQGLDREYLTKFFWRACRRSAEIHYARGSVLYFHPHCGERRALRFVVRPAEQRWEDWLVGDFISWKEEAHFPVSFLPLPAALASFWIRVR